jgi:hypothetical protein
MTLNHLKSLFSGIRLPRKKRFEHSIVSDKDGARFATPEDVAKYRAARLKCSTIADISCGIGGQTIYFAKECDMVYAVEIDAKKIDYARKNCKLLGIDNVEFICGDALSPEVIRQLPELDIVFSDPARPASEDMRDIGSLRPAIPEVISSYSSIASDFAFEAPPQLTPDRIPFECEKEYVSLDGKINRLNLYFGSLMKCDTSAVALPSRARIGSASDAQELQPSEKLACFAYEPEESVERAGLLSQFAHDLEKQAPDISLFLIDSKRLVLTSELPVEHPMLKNKYKVLNVLDFDTALINSFLKKNGFGTVILRAAVEPKEYWDIRNRLEDNLSGDRKAHLFLKDRKAILCEIL